MRRIVSLWLPNLATDRIARDRPAWRSERLATIASLRGRLCVAAASAAARDDGIRPPMPLADARALMPDLRCTPDEPTADARMLARLADWCGRYTPWTATDTSAPDIQGNLPRDHGIWLDITGAAALHGGEAMLLADLERRLAALGFAASAGLADTPGAAWALARAAAQGSSRIAPAGQSLAAIAALPVAALRLPLPTANALAHLGLRRIGDLAAIPRTSLARRFGALVGHRLDQASGHLREPISPTRPVSPHRVHLAFAEPIGDPAAIARATRHLLADLCDRLARHRRGARRIELALYHCDGATHRLVIGTSRASHDAAHLARLFDERLASVTRGEGVDMMALAAPLTVPLAPADRILPWPAAAIAESEDSAESEDMAQLVDRLSGRLGDGAVVHLAPRGSHIPERAVAMVAAPESKTAADAPDEEGWCDSNGRDSNGRDSNWRDSNWHDLGPRPVRLLAPPEPIDAVAAVPDGPPALFRWRRILHRIIRADGPERIAPEWWRDDTPARQSTRDYYRLEDSDGHRFWVYRAGLYASSYDSAPAGAGRPRWYLHGYFG